MDTSSSHTRYAYPVRLPDGCPGAKVVNWDSLWEGKFCTEQP